MVYLFHLEFDGALQIVDLVDDVVTMSQQGGELASLVQTGSQKPGDLFDQRFGSKESIVLLCQLLDKLLLLVQLLQIVSAHEWNALLLGFITMLLIAENADGELGSGNVAQPIQKDEFMNTRPDATKFSSAVL